MRKTSTMSQFALGRRSASPAPLSPFSIYRSPTDARSQAGTAISQFTVGGTRMSPGGIDADQMDIISPTGGRRNLQRRASMQPPPIGQRNTAWGKYASVQDILSRPTPPRAIAQGEHTTLSLQGGRWSYHEPINQMYILSKISHQTPGPGQYGDLGSPDPVVTGKTTPFGKLKGGKISQSPLRPHSYTQCRLGKSVPGPGAYNTDHLFGIYARIQAAIPRPKSQLDFAQHEDYAAYDDGDFSDSSDSDNQGQHPAGFDDGEIWAKDPIFDDGSEMNITTIEQRLVMSQAVPLPKMTRLGTTKYSKLRKDAMAPKVRKIIRLAPHPRSASAMSYFGQDDT